MTVAPLSASWLASADPFGDGRTMRASPGIALMVAGDKLIRGGSPVPGSLELAAAAASLAPDRPAPSAPLAGVSAPGESAGTGLPDSARPTAKIALCCLAKL